MNPKIQTVLAELRRRFEMLYGPRLVQMILYGSQARGDAEPGSDIDVLVVLKGEVSPCDEIARTEKDAMRCAICKQGETRLGTATVTLERGNMTLIVKAVPAQVCENCGEEYVDDDATARLLKTAEDAARAGVKVEIREYVAA